MSEPYVLCLGSGAADLEFPSLPSLARAIVKLRDDHPKGGDMIAINAVVARGSLPNGSAVAIRLDDAPAGVRPSHGTFLAYAFVPRPWAERRNVATMLMEAICDAAVIAGKVAA